MSVFLRKDLSLQRIGYRNFLIVIDVLVDTLGDILFRTKEQVAVKYM
jgi:hypothetical protein